MVSGRQSRIDLKVRDGGELFSSMSPPNCSLDLVLTLYEDNFVRKRKAEGTPLKMKPITFYVLPPLLFTACAAQYTHP